MVTLTTGGPSAGTPPDNTTQPKGDGKHLELNNPTLATFTTGGPSASTPRDNTTQPKGDGKCTFTHFLLTLQPKF